MFTPIHQARASGEIVSQIERAIFSAQLLPGDRLQSERELAEQFGVSRITGRDAQGVADRDPRDAELRRELTFGLETVARRELRGEDRSLDLGDDLARGAGPMDR